MIVYRYMYHVLPDGLYLQLAALIKPPTVARHRLKSASFSGFSALAVLVLSGGPVDLAAAIDF